MLKNLFFLLIVSILLVSCTGRVKKNSNKSNKYEIENLKSDSICLETFSELPDEIDGCACLFFLSENDKDANEYICVNNFANLAFMKLKGRILSLELIKYEDNVYMYQGEEFILRIEVTGKVSAEYESSYIEGVIIVSHKGNIKRVKFIGTCSC